MFIEKRNLVEAALKPLLPKQSFDPANNFCCHANESSNLDKMLYEQSISFTNNFYSNEKESLVYGQVLPKHEKSIDFDKAFYNNGIGNNSSDINASVAAKSNHSFIYFCLYI